MLEAGANPNIRGEAGVTALMSAAYKGNAEAVQLLLNAGADASLKDDGGMTALDSAKYAGNAEVIRLLDSSISYKH